MRVIFLSTLTVLTIGAAHAAETFTARDVLPYCTFNPPQSEGYVQETMKRYCLDVVKSARSIANKMAGSRGLRANAGCADIPESVSTEDSMRAVVRYGDMHPDYMHLDFQIFVVVALKSTWPCNPPPRLDPPPPLLGVPPPILDRPGS